MQKKKILIVCQHFWPESFRINDITDYFIDHDIEVDVLCGIPNYPKGQIYKGYSYTARRSESYNGASVRRVFEIPRGDNTNTRIFLNYISFPVASLFHIPRLLTKNYDKIFIYQLSPVMMAISGILVGKIKRTETVMYVLDLWPENLFSVLDIKNNTLRIIVTRISHWHYRHADKLIALSEKMKKKLLEVTEKSHEKIIVLPQACEKIYESNIYDQDLTNKFSRGFNILYAGNISPAQSFSTILDAASLLKEQGIIDINWIIVGDGMSRTWLEKEVIKRKLSKNFYFEGHKSIHEIPKYTHIADVLVGCLVKSNLLEATIPAKVMSYLAAGKPMVLAMDGEVQELISNTIQCGYAGPTEDSEAFAKNISKIYHLSAMDRSKMGIRAQKYHFAHFERNLILDKLHKFIFT